VGFSQKRTFKDEVIWRFSIAKKKVKIKKKLYSVFSVMPKMIKG
jgi:hypothetical protein